MYRNAFQEFFRRKYHFHAYIFALIAGMAIVILGASTPIRAEDMVPEILPPAAPLAVSAVVKEDSVVLNWQPAEGGSNPVSGYIVSRRVGQGDFEEIGRQSGTNYEDLDGRVGYEYRVTAFDDQTPALLSQPSDTVKAEMPPLIAPSSTPDTEALSPGDAQSLGSPESLASSTNADSEIKTSNDKLSMLESGLQARPDNVLHTIIDQFIQSKEDLIGRQSHFDQSQRNAAAQGCSDQESRLETSMSSLSETLQMKVIEALARCQLLQ